MAASLQDMVSMLGQINVSSNIQSIVIDMENSFFSPPVDNEKQNAFS